MTVDLKTRYLGLELDHPIMPGASPLADDLDTVRRLEDAGAAAITMRSLFEEQLNAVQIAFQDFVDGFGEGHAEAMGGYFPSTADYALGPDGYLEQLRRIRAAVRVPVIASLNGVSLGGWTHHARLIEQAGASALELNMYTLVTEPRVNAATVEARQLEVVRAVLDEVTIPVAVKLSPYYSALPSFVHALEEAGVAGVVLFNRLYEADIDPEALELDRKLQLSHPGELLPRLRWLAILSSRAEMSLTCSGGVHDAMGALKAIMAGATAVQMVSALLRHGPAHLTSVIDGLRQWLDEHEYAAIGEACGCMNDARAPDPSALTRANYISLLQSWRRGSAPWRDEPR